MQEKSRTARIKRAQNLQYEENELYEFYAACNHALLEILEKKPDLIVIPLRGAEPLLRGIQTIANENKISAMLPRVVMVRTGTVSKVKDEGMIDNIIGDYEKESTIKEQMQEIEQRLRAGIKAVGKENPKIMLLDEVRQGGSIVKHQELIQALIRTKFEKAALLETIAIADASYQKTAKYQQFVRGGKIKEFPVQRLFTTDSLKVLTGLAKRKNGTIRLVPSRIALRNRLDLQARLQKIHKQSIKARRIL